MSSDTPPVGTRGGIIAEARERGIELETRDIHWDRVDGWTIDGLPASQWIDGMTQE